MKKPFLNIVMLFTMILALQGQDSRKLFLGLQPDITREIKGNEEKVFSVNIVPLVAQLYLNEFTGIRLAPLLNLEPKSKEISHVGAQLGFPVYFLLKRGPKAGGVYAAPVVGFSHNKQSEGNELTLAIEPGYSWLTLMGFSINLGLQLGGTYFTPTEQAEGWRNHAGLKFSLGYTFRSL